VVSDGPCHQVVTEYLRSGVGTIAAREWNDARRAPGNHIVRLRAVRVRDEEGQVREVMDIRRAIGVEMEFEVLEGGRPLVPCYQFINEEGACVFTVHDQDPAWRRRPRPPGCYTSTAWIPGNYLSEGTLVVGAAVSTVDPVTVHFFERDAAAFQVVDSLDGNSARGDYAGPWPGAVRPLLRWTTEFHPGSTLGDAPVAATVSL
jgi:lipopolysaccharide transport system ATP-binding protein